ncbi:MAG TPA: major capsid protein, partial [Polyangiaceae bacterium]
DFVPKATHMVTCGAGGYGATWATDGSTGVPLADLDLLARVVRRDGKKQPKQLVFGSSALQRFLANAAVQKALDKNVINLGQMAPVARGQGATFQGFVWIGHYKFEMWTYDGFYKHPQTGAITPYVDDDNVIMLSEGARLDLSFGSIPMIRRPEAAALPFLPPRISDGGMGIDLTTNSWFTPDGKHLKVSAGTRPLTIPTAIDTFARLNVTS